MQVPTPFPVTVDPLTEQTDGVVDARVTGSPEVAEADTIKDDPTVRLDKGVRLIV